MIRLTSEERKVIYAGVALLLIVLTLLFFRFAAFGALWSVYPGNAMPFAYHIEKDAVGRCDHYDTQNIFVYNPDGVPVRSYTAQQEVIANGPGLSGYVGFKETPVTLYHTTSNIIYDTTDYRVGTEFKVTYSSLANYPNICRTRWIIDFVSPPVTPPCTPVIACSEWSACSAGQQSRTCTDGCGSSTTEFRACAGAGENATQEQPPADQQASTPAEPEDASAESLTAIALLAVAVVIIVIAWRKRKG